MKASRVGFHLVAREDKDLGHRDRVEPSLDPSPHRAEEHGGPDDEDAIKRLGVMRRRELRRRLHV